MKFSIVTPSFNQGKFIEDCFKSILKQKGNFKIQYIIVDALSTDETFKAIKDYRTKFKKAGIDFLIVREKDSGQVDAINKGFKKADGDILAFLNSDDFYEPSALKTINEYFDYHPKVDWVFGGWNFVNEKGKLFRSYKPSFFPENRFRAYGFNIGQPSCFFKRSIYAKVGGLDKNLDLTLDYDLWLKFIKHSKPGVINSVLSNMRYYSKTKSSQNMLRHNHEAFKTAKKYLPKNLILLIFLYFNFVIGFVMIKLGRNISQNIK